MTTKDGTAFLEAYRRLEDAISHSTKLRVTNVLGYENSLSDSGDTEQAEKLKACRIIRNYMTHHADGVTFLTATPKMTAFIGKLADGIASMEMTAGKAARKAPVLTPSTSMRDAAESFSSHGYAWLPYADRDGKVVGAVSVETIAAMVAQGMRSSTSIGRSARMVDVPMVDASAPATDVLGHDAIVVNGRTGAFKGVTRSA